MHQAAACETWQCKHEQTRLLRAVVAPVGDTAATASASHTWAPVVQCFFGMAGQG